MVSAVPTGSPGPQGEACDRDGGGEGMRVPPGYAGRELPPTRTPNPRSGMRPRPG